ERLCWTEFDGKEKKKKEGEEEEVLLRMVGRITTEQIEAAQACRCGVYRRSFFKRLPTISANAPRMYQCTHGALHKAVKKLFFNWVRTYYTTTYKNESTLLQCSFCCLRWSTEKGNSSSAEGRREKQSCCVGQQSAVSGEWSAGQQVSPKDRIGSDEKNVATSG
ncbi:unnamed protein product, partial [Nesidiocoris tenuis]